MIVVDTNVISELMRGEPHPAVLAWVAAQPRALLYTTRINQAEILYGVAVLPEPPTRGVGCGGRGNVRRGTLPAVFCRSRPRLQHAMPKS